MRAITIPVTYVQHSALVELSGLSPKQLVNRGLVATETNCVGRATIEQLRSEFFKSAIESHVVLDFLDGISDGYPLSISLVEDGDGGTDAEISILLQGKSCESAALQFGTVECLEQFPDPETRIAQAVLGTVQAALRHIS